MWVPRTPEEEKKWLVVAHSSARSYATQIGGVVGVVLALAFYFGISLVPRAAMFAGAAVRPLGMVGSLIVGGLIGWGIFREVNRTELKNKLSLTVCPKCEKLGKLNDGQACACGGTFVKTSTVRWVEAPVAQEDQDPIL